MATVTGQHAITYITASHLIYFTRLEKLGRTTRHLDDVPVHWGVIRKHASAHISAAGEELDEGVAGFNDNGCHFESACFICHP